MELDEPAHRVGAAYDLARVVEGDRVVCAGLARPAVMVRTAVECIEPAGDGERLAERLDQEGVVVRVGVGGRAILGAPHHEPDILFRLLQVRTDHQPADVPEQARLGPGKIAGDLLRGRSEEGER